MIPVTIASKIIKYLLIDLKKKVKKPSTMKTINH
jgi:hypothetical protein